MTNNNSLKEFVAKQIRHLRLEKGLTQEYLAEKADLGFLCACTSYQEE